MSFGNDWLSGEERLIAGVFAPLATHPGALGLTDDCAVFAPPEGCDLVVTADTVIGGVHFFAGDPAYAVAGKALRVNLSDLAAKGAAPLGYLLSLALPRELDEGWLAEFAEGLRADAGRYGCPMLGGDTDRTPGPIVIAVSMFGSVPKGTMVRRAGARDGDLVFVSGTVGDSALGLALRNDPARDWPLTAAQAQHLTDRYLLPQPRNALAEAVRTHASAAMDVSDGLVGDLTKLCRVSKVTANVEVARVPLSEAARGLIAAEPALLEPALTGGDDYEIVCTVPPGKAESFKAAAKAAGVPVSGIGAIAAGEGARFIGPDGEPLAFRHASFSHF